jgi:hypothetical protein
MPQENRSDSLFRWHWSTKANAKRRELRFYAPNDLRENNIHTQSLEQVPEHFSMDVDCAHSFCDARPVIQKRFRNGVLPK